MLNSLILELKNNIRSGGNFIDITRGCFSGKHAFVVTCGPSMKNWREIYESQSDKDNCIIMCVKQSIRDIGHLCDVHFINDWNIQRYHYPNNDPLILLGISNNSLPTFSRRDVEYLVKKNQFDDLDHTLAATKNFIDYEIDKVGLVRPWGPGIMYEIVFPFLVHSNVSKITVVGWDIADSIGANKHFYDKTTSRGVIHKVGSKSDCRGIKKCINAIDRLIVGKYLIYPKNLTLHLLGKKYNLASMLPGEAELVSESINSLKLWLSDKHIEFEVASNSIWQPQSPTVSCAQ